ncbi:sodium/proline symporter PutP [bacterium]|nr:sodium/proline symporter PutP [bacterium]
MTIDMKAILVTFLSYIALMLAIGTWAYRRTHKMADYILGGRGLGPCVAALSACASDMSGWLLMGLPGYAYLSGLEAVWLAGGLLAGTYTNWRMMARRLRIYTEAADNSLTIPDFLEKRFDDKRHLLRIISAFFILVFFLFYTSSGLVAGGKLFESVFNLPYESAVGVGALTIVIYTFMGGFLAVSWTDLIQGLLMFAALLIVPTVVITDIGGYNKVITGIRQINMDLLKPLTDNNGRYLSLIGVISLIGWGLGYFGQPHILARFKAIRSPDALSIARRIAITWTGLALIGAILVGVTGIVHQNPPLQGADSERIFILLVSALFHPVIAGILLAAILAAIMSTADSQLLVSSSALAEDFYKALFRRKAGQKELLFVGRCAVVVIALLAYTLALDRDSKVLDLVAYAWAGFGSAFGPTLILALYWWRMNWQGALAGIIGGGLTVVIWKQLEGGIFDLYEIVPGFVLSLTAILVTTLLTKEPNESIKLRHNRILSQSFSTI